MKVRISGILLNSKQRKPQRLTQPTGPRLNEGTTGSAPQRATENVAAGIDPRRSETLVIQMAYA